jgi:hypothetical protein
MSFIQSLKNKRKKNNGWHDLPISLWIINECLNNIKNIFPWFQKYIIGYMGKMVFMTFGNEKTKKVKIINVSEEPNKKKVNLGPAEHKPPNTWMKSKWKTSRIFIFIIWTTTEY